MTTDEAKLIKALRISRKLGKLFGKMLAVGFTDDQALLLIRNLTRNKGIDDA